MNSLPAHTYGTHNKTPFTASPTNKTAKDADIVLVIGVPVGKPTQMAPPKGSEWGSNEG